MNDIEYQCFVSEFCECMGLDDWQAVVHSEHLEINGKTVGLIHSAESGGARGMSVYVDLGVIPEHACARVHKALLIANLTGVQDAEGFFGIHPVTGNGVYHLRHTTSQSPQMLANRLAAVFNTVVFQYQGMVSG